MDLEYASKEEMHGMAGVQGIISELFLRSGVEQDWMWLLHGRRPFDCTLTAMTYRSYINEERGMLTVG